MDGVSAHCNPPPPPPDAVERIFNDFKGRRTAIIKALTTERTEFIQRCDPEHDNMCLYGHPNGRWEVSLPADEVPSELPEPVIGINYAKTGMNVEEWIYMVSTHSDAWLHAVAFYFGARFGFNKDDRQQLFHMMNALPTLYEIVSANSGSNRATSNSNGPQGMQSNEGGGEGKEEEDEEQALCRACGESGADEFWIFCETCLGWFHGRCVKMTKAKSEHIQKYKCPSCCKKRRL